MRYLEILTYKIAIWFIRRGWGASCADLDENWWRIGGCGSCKAKKVIEFLEDSMDFV